jgi:methyl-accepting chemotaxis protein
MRTLSIKTWLTSILTFIAILFAAFAWLSYDGLNGASIASSQITDKAVPSLAAAKDMQATFQAKSLAIARHLLAQTPAEIEAVEAQIARTKQAVNTVVEQYETLVETDAEKALTATIKTEIADYDRITDDVLKLSRAQLTDEAMEIINQQLNPLGDKTSLEIEKLEQMNLDIVQASSRASAAMFADKILIGFVFCCVIGLGILAGIVFIIRSVANPIVRITAAMQALAGGDTTLEVPFLERRDEIGAMAGAVAVFRKAAIENSRMSREAEEHRQRSEDDRRAAQQAAEADAAQRMQAATASFAAALKRLAGGDLAFQLTEPFSSDFEGLRADFNISIRQLGDTLSTIANGIATMEAGTREISGGAQDLARRTEKQAAELEETAAALEQITANVSSSTMRTAEARAAATTANRSAATSAEIVTDAEAAMSRIEAASQQISNIIGVIDQIAFQTNLLALNAGVEAARAGDAGKGFAVVAQEVRELAQRSASAAKEIKTLIDNSNAEVAVGVKLVRETGTALGAIGSEIGDINAHMAAIASAAQEQSVGLSEVNTAVRSMDQTTQQNAAMVEQTTAASAALAAEAARLRDLIASFALESAATGQTALLRQTASAMANPAPPAPSHRRNRSAASSAAAAVQPRDWEAF